MLRSIRWILGAAAFVVAGSAHAADVKITGVHNCCGQCAKAIQTTLEGAGATNIMVSKGDISFTAEDAKKAVDALYGAGYAGKLPQGTRAPASGAQGVKGKEIKVEGTHNCCPACAKALNEALAPVGKATVKPKDTAITVTSDNEIEARAVVTALRNAGFNVKVTK